MGKYKKYFCIKCKQEIINKRKNSKYCKKCADEVRISWTKEYFLKKYLLRKMKV